MERVCRAFFLLAMFWLRSQHLDRQDNTSQADSDDDSSLSIQQIITYGFMLILAGGGISFVITSGILT